MMVNMMNDEMDEQTEDLMQAQKEEIAALDDGIQALCQRREEIIESHTTLLAKYKSGNSGADNT
jgi:phage host-nuclease inhibitor protein Gam